jgi:hypothetical protein
MECIITTNNILLVSRILPAPSQSSWDRDEEAADEAATVSTSVVLAMPTAPPYGQRRGWIPRSEDVSSHFIANFSMDMYPRVVSIK